ITLSSVHSTIIELSLMPEDNADETQFGFRKGRGTTTAIFLAHDVAKYMNNNDTPMYICSLDAHKCFDSIWHDGLFYKLAGKIPDLHWVFLYKWYISSKAHARWAGELSCLFNISKGIYIIVEISVLFLYSFRFPILVILFFLLFNVNMFIPYDL
ncbi:unnamed protein product, partial [Meganyctiphanes norvegica]